MRKRCWPYVDAATIVTVTAVATSGHSKRRRRRSSTAPAIASGASTQYMNVPRICHVRGRPSSDSKSTCCLGAYRPQVRSTRTTATFGSDPR